MIRLGYLYRGGRISVIGIQHQSAWCRRNPVCTRRSSCFWVKASCPRRWGCVSAPPSPPVLFLLLVFPQQFRGLLLRGGAHGLLQVLHGIVDAEVVVVVVLVDGLEDLCLQVPGLVLQGVLPEQILYGFADLPDLVLVVDVGLQLQVLDVAPYGVSCLCQRGLRCPIPLGLGLLDLLDDPIGLLLLLLGALNGDPIQCCDHHLPIVGNVCSPLFTGGWCSARQWMGPLYQIRRSVSTVPEPFLGIGPAVFRPVCRIPGSFRRFFGSGLSGIVVLWSHPNCGWLWNGTRRPKTRLHRRSKHD